MNDIIREKININFLYKFRIYQFLKNNFYTHSLCTGNSASTYEYERHLNKNKLFFKLSTKIEETIEKSLNCEGYIHSMWFNINQKGSKTVLHHHNTQNENNKISGVYYFKKPEDSGNIIFHQEKTKRKIEVDTNDILIFDANLLHETEVNNSNKDRIVCGFNYKISNYKN